MALTLITKTYRNMKICYNNVKEQNVTEHEKAATDQNHSEGLWKHSFLGPIPEFLFHWVLAELENIFLTRPQLMLILLVQQHWEPLINMIQQSSQPGNKNRYYSGNNEQSQVWPSKLSTCYQMSPRSQVRLSYRVENHQLDPNTCENNGANIIHLD